MKFQSNAEWPEGVCSSMHGDNISTDIHSSYEGAEAVCKGLEEEGFGGQREDFPIKTWVSLENQKLKCQNNNCLTPDSPVVLYHQNTQYCTEEDNWVMYCKTCKKENDAYWDDQWRELYGSFDDNMLWPIQTTVFTPLKYLSGALKVVTVKRKPMAENTFIGLCLVNHKCSYCGHEYSGSITEIVTCPRCEAKRLAEENLTKPKLKLLSEYTQT